MDERNVATEREDDCGYARGCDYQLYVNEYIEYAGMTNIYLCARHMRFHFCAGVEESNCILNEEGFCHYSRRRRDAAACGSCDVHTTDNSVMIGDNITPLANIGDMMMMMMPTTESSAMNRKKHAHFASSNVLTSDYETFHRVVYDALMRNSKAFRDNIKLAEEEESHTPHVRNQKRSLSFQFIRCIYDVVEQCNEHLKLSDDRLLDLLCQFTEDMCMPKNSYHFNTSPKDTGVSLQKKNMLFSNIYVHLSNSMKLNPALRDLLL